MFRRFTALALGILLSIAGLSLQGVAPDAGASPTTRGDLMGFGVTLPTNQAQVNLVAAQGVKWIRIGYQWDWITGNHSPANTNPATWAWAAFQDRINWAHAAALKVLAVAEGSPWWANGRAFDPCDQTTPPTCTVPSTNGFFYPDVAHLPNWMDYVNGMITRGVDAIEVWNEPNEVQFAKGGRNAATQAGLQRYTYDNVKAAHPSTPVVSAGLASGGSDSSFGNYCTQSTAPGDPLQFLQDEYAAAPASYNSGRGFKGSFDALGSHPYSPDPTAFYPYCSTTSGQTLARYNGVSGISNMYSYTLAQNDAKPIWATEFGVYMDTHTETQAKQLFLDYYTAFGGLRALSVPIANSFVYTLQDDLLGVYKSDGTERMQAVVVRNEAALAPDSTAPVISNTALGYVRGSSGTVSATVTWDTDEYATSKVSWGLTASYGTSSEKTNLRTDHTITMSGLQPGKTYHYQVSTTDAYGNIRTSADATAVAGLEYQPLGDPSVQRILDTRSATNPTTCRNASGTVLSTCPRLVANSPMTFNVTGLAGVPDTASAVTLNITAFTPTANSSLVIYPSNASAPASRDLTLVAGTTSSNLAVVQLDANGRLTINSQTGVDVVADVEGYYESPPGSAGGSYVPKTSAVVADSRSGSQTSNCTPSPCAPLSVGGITTVQVIGNGGVVAGASSAALTLTVTGTTAAGSAQIYPSDIAQPDARNLSVSAAGDTVTETVVAKLSSTGAIKVYASGGGFSWFISSAGYYKGGNGAGSDYVPIMSARLLDTRSGSGYPGGCVGGSCTKLDSSTTSLTLQLSGQGGLPATDITAASITVTAINGNGNKGYLKLGSTSNPGSRSLSFAGNETATNAAVIKLDADGRLVVTLLGETGSLVPSTDLLVDVSGYYVATS